MSGECGVISNPERALWQMVLHQVVHDALLGPKGVPRMQFAQRWQEARAYVANPSEDLAMVCAMAGVEMDSLIERMQVQVSNLVAPETTAARSRVQED